MRREQQLIGFEETSRFPQACFKLLCQRLAQKIGPIGIPRIWTSSEISRCVPKRVQPPSATM